jgi:hypothetical protein
MESMMGKLRVNTVGVAASWAIPADDDNPVPVEKASTEE